MTHALRCCSDLPSLLDEWATSLFRELDYNREAQNGMRFKRLFGELEVSQLLSPASCQMSLSKATPPESLKPHHGSHMRTAAWHCQSCRLCASSVEWCCVASWLRQKEADW